jgi:hypothetical protein
MLIVIVATSIWFGFLLGVVSMALLACSKPELEGACVRPASAHSVGTLRWKMKAGR